MTVDPLEQEYDIEDQARLKLMSAIPEAFADGKILWEKLHESLGDILDDDDETAFEHYGLNWPGKRKAKKVAATPSTLTLTPLKGEGIDEDTTENIFIEGDNLEVLKILYKSYKDKIKMIYIDPPYNTGNDFVYNDDFRMTEEEFMRAEGTVDEIGNKLVANKKTSGRFHANWLNMMYPRLKIARELLKDDGVIFISIDDNEVGNLRLLCDEIFGEDNLITQICHKARASISNDKIISANHNHILLYAKSQEMVFKNRNKIGLDPDLTGFANPDNDPRGSWKLTPVDGPGGAKKGNPYYEFLGVEGYFRYSKQTMEEKYREGLIVKTANGLQQKYFLSQAEQSRKTDTTWWEDGGLTSTATRRLQELMENKTFDTPKPIELVYRMLKLMTFTDRKNALILDFFSGSATTAHAVMQLNAEDEGSRKFMMVQLPEETEEKSEAYKAGYTTIAEIAKERIRRASRAVRENNPSFAGDLGFQVYKTIRSNHKKWGKYSITTPQEADNLFATHQHFLIDDWEYDSVVTEILLTEGFALTSKIEAFDSVTTNQISRITDPDKEYLLYVCLDEHINPDTIKALNMNDNDIFICLGSAIDDQNLSALNDKGRIRTL